MRLFLITFLFFKFFSPVYANTIYYLTKIPNLKVYDLTAINGIKYLVAEKSFKVGIVENNVQCNKPSENFIGVFGFLLRAPNFVHNQLNGIANKTM